jgi:hypothetical protein
VPQWQAWLSRFEVPALLEKHVSTHYPQEGSLAGTLPTEFIRFLFQSRSMVELRLHCLLL